MDRQIKRLDDAYNAGAYAPEEYADKRKELLRQKAVLQDEHRQAEDEKRRREAQAQTISTMRELLPHFHQWVAEDEPTVVKFHLSRVVTLTAHPDRTITAEFI